METILSTSMMDATFTLKDVFYIGGIIVGAVVQFYAFKIKQVSQDEKLKSLEKDMTELNQKMITNSHGKTGQIKELKIETNKRFEVMEKRQDEHYKSLEKKLDDINKTILTHFQSQKNG